MSGQRSLLGAKRSLLEKTSFDLSSTSTEIPETILRVNEQGQYSIQAESSTGTRIDLVDRMAGVMSSDGQPGSRDGRIDIVLDKGEYKVKLQPDRNSRGRVNLTVHSFEEKHSAASPDKLPFLLEGQSITTTLGDLEQRSYWIHIPEKNVFHLELMGRNLTNIRLWRDGEWIEAVSLMTTTREAQAGQPMTHIEISQSLRSGYYLLVCYGGKGRSWANDNGEQPLLLRRGAPYLGEAGIRKISISPFGSEVFWASGKTDYFQLYRDELEPTRLKTSSYRTGRSRYAAGEEARITRKSKDPWCVITGAHGGEKQWLVVEGQPGSELELSFFIRELTHEFPTRRTGRSTESFWISSIDSVEGRDAIDLTPLLFDFDSYTILKAPALKIGPNNPMVRRVNALDESNVYLTVQESGTYRIVENPEAGATARYRFIPFEYAFRFSDRIPELQSPDEPFELTSGVYIFNFAPEKRGILHFALLKEQGESDSSPAETDSDQARTLEEAQKLLEASAHAATYAARSSFVWPKVEIQLKKKEPTVLLLNERINAATGLVVRELPLDLREPLAFRLDPGRSVEVSAAAKEESLLAVEGSDFELQIGTERIGSETSLHDLALPRGAFTLTLKNSSDREQLYTLSTSPRERGAVAPLPEKRPLEQSLPLITENRPIFSDYGRREIKSFLLRVDQPALYRIETSGRLAMGLTVRTPLVTSLFKSEQNGVGRNALIQSYLKSGYYLIEARTLGLSRGRAGLHLRRNPLRDTGELLENLVSRKTIDADQALRYGIEIRERGRYRLSTYGLGTRYSHRLEDSAGWPLGPAVGQGEIVREFRPGRYYYYTLPKPLRTRRLTLLEPIDRDSLEENYLPLNTTLERLWRESAGRTPDSFRFDLSAPLEASFSLTKRMVASLIGPNGNRSVEIFGGRDEPLSLEAGEYEVRVKSIDENDRFPYTLRLSTTWLIPGHRQRISRTPATIPVSLGADQHYDLWSFGESDVRASLLGTTGNVPVVESDDRKDDWNFLISKKLKAGRYTLRIERVGHWGGPFTVYMESRTEIGTEIGADLGFDFALPFEHETTLGRSVLSIPITTGPRDGLVQILAKAEEPLSIAVHAGERVLAVGENRLFIPLKGSRNYTLKVWHLGDVPTAVRVEAREMRSTREEGEILSLNETSASHYVPGPSIRLSNPTGLSYSMRREQGDEPATLLFSAGLERECSPIDWSAVNTARSSGWLVNARGSEIGAIRIEPLRLTEAASVAVQLGDIPQSFRLTNERGRVLLLEVSSPGLSTGAAVMRDTLYDASRFEWDGMLLETSRTLTGVLDPGEYQGRIWRTEPVSGGQPLAGRRVSLTPRSYLMQKRYRLSDAESLQLSVEPQRAIGIHLDESADALHLLLTRGLVAFVWQNGQSHSFVSAHGGNTSKRISVTGGRLVLINTGHRRALARVQRSTGETPSKLTIAPDRGFEQILRQGGMLTFTLPPMLSAADDLYLCVAGGLTNVLLRGKDGRIYRPPGRSEPGQPPFTILPYRAGELVVTHTGDYLKVWISKRDEIHRTFVHGNTVPDFNRLRSNPLSDGETKLDDAVRIRNFTLSEMQFVKINTEAPGISALYKDGRIVAVSGGGKQSGSRISRFLKAGKYRLYTRAIRGNLLSGVLCFARTTPVRLERGRSELRIIGPSEVQAFRFYVRTAGRNAVKIGIGLQAQTDSLSATLYSDEFQPLGSGALIFAELEQGTYYLVVHGEPGGHGEPVQYRPVLLGLDGSLQEVPEDTIRRYVEEVAD